MKIQLINPNTSVTMTDKIAQSALTVALPSSDILARCPEHGPESIECALDETIASAALLDLIADGEKKGVDAHIIACFGDPALDAAREIAQAPVIGIAGAAFQIASLVSHRFGVVTTLSRTVPTAHHLLQRYGYAHLCTGVRATDIPVLALESVHTSLYEQLRQECRQALSQDGAEAIVLGCAGMSDLAAELSQDLQVPVIDGVTAAVKLAESLYSLQLNTAKCGHYGAPIGKAFHGRYQHWSQ